MSLSGHRPCPSRQSPTQDPSGSSRLRMYHPHVPHRPERSRSTGGTVGQRQGQCQLSYTARPPPPVVLPAAPCALLGLGGAFAPGFAFGSRYRLRKAYSVSVTPYNRCCASPTGLGAPVKRLRRHEAEAAKPRGKREAFPLRGVSVSVSARARKKESRRSPRSRPMTLASDRDA